MKSIQFFPFFSFFIFLLVADSFDLNAQNRYTFSKKKASEVLDMFYFNTEPNDGDMNVNFPNIIEVDWNEEWLFLTGYISYKPDYEGDGKLLHGPLYLSYEEHDDEDGVVTLTEYRLNYKNGKLNGKIQFSRKVLLPDESERSSRDKWRVYDLLKCDCITKSDTEMDEVIYSNVEYVLNDYDDTVTTIKQKKTHDISIDYFYYVNLLNATPVAEKPVVTKRRL